MSCCINIWRSRKGQGTVEAACFIPLLFLLLLILCQPGILLYNHMVMQGAAAEGCRLLATKVDQGAYSDDKYRGYVKRRLAAVPPLALFHDHQEAADWQIDLLGDAQSRTVTVRIENKLRPLPVLSLFAAAIGQLDASGHLTQVVECHMPTQNDWVGHGAT
ncbi:MAG: pilus assembly protein [Coriobacteriales bacterium]|jgi:Flp pilus assembly protein TadG|nr:pilus assembly protein [Coriobacteriales bacterium]